MSCKVFSTLGSAGSRLVVHFGTRARELIASERDEVHSAVALLFTVWARTTRIPIFKIVLESIVVLPLCVDPISL